MSFVANPPNLFNERPDSFCKRSQITVVPICSVRKKK